MLPPKENPPAGVLPANGSEKNTQTVQRHVTATSPAAQTALVYAARDWWVFPVNAATKTPHTSRRTNGSRFGATNAPALIERAFRRWPRAAVGVATGRGLLVLDIDTAAGHGVDGRCALDDLEAKHGPLPRTLTASTPTGGEHFYFRVPFDVGIPSSVGRLGPGIDVRCDAGFVVAPSMLHGEHDGRRWVTSQSHPIADAPRWLLELTRDPRALSPEWAAVFAQDVGRGVSRKPDDLPKFAPEDVELKIRVALAVIPADLPEYDWYRIGCAIHHELGDLGFALFHEWSQTASAKYRGENDCARKWRLSCTRARDIRADTIYWHADQHDRGWRDLYRRYARAAS